LGDPDQPHCTEPDTAPKLLTAPLLRGAPLRALRGEPAMFSSQRVADIWKSAFTRCCGILRMSRKDWTLVNWLRNPSSDLFKSIRAHRLMIPNTNASVPAGIA